MILGIKKWFVINEFRSKHGKRLRSKENLNTCNPLGKYPFQENTLLYYAEIRSKRVRYMHLYSVIIILWDR